MNDLFPVQVLLPSGEIRTFLCVEDVIEVVDETGGCETAALIRKQLADQADEMEELEDEIKDYQKDWEQEQEDKTMLLNDLMEQAEAIQNVLDAPRLNRKAIQEHITEIMDLIRQNT